jgi:pyruvate,orthophosphate dikinase
MARPLGQWTLALDGSELPGRELIGGKAWSVARMRSLGLPVPPAFVVTTRACARFLETGALPEGLDEELAAGIAWLEQETGRQFGGTPPLLVSVRSGAPISMPGMMDTVLNLGMTDAAECALAQECGDPEFARDTHRRFLELYATIVLKTVVPPLGLSDLAEWRSAITDTAGTSVPHKVDNQLHGAVRAVFDSWNSRRARRYRQHHGIPDELGTAVTVQAMVFGNLDAHSGTGVLFTRNPITGSPEPYGEYLARAQGEDVVSGKFTPRPLSEMHGAVPAAHGALMVAARRLEEMGTDVQDIEFTVERGRLYLLQTRAAKRGPQAAVRIAVDMAREGVIDVDTALARVSAEQVRILLSPRIEGTALASAVQLASGEGACPGVGTGVVVTSSDEAEDRASRGEDVILARPTTSPEDLHGMIAARAVITEHGGSTSHASVVSRALGRACVVGCGPGSVTALAGRTVTVEGQSGRIYEGALDVVAPDVDHDPYLVELERWCRERSRLVVLSPGQAPDEGVLQLDSVVGAEDPQRIAAILAGLAPGHRGARGGAIATEAGVRAALDTGLEFIVAEPVLPALLLAAQSSRQVSE